MIRLRFRIALAVLWFTAIATVALLPFPVKNSLGTPLRYFAIDLFGHTIAFNPHRLIHLAVFAVSTWIATLFFSTRRALLVMLAFAFLTEAAEHYVYPNTVLEWPDIIDDAAGVVSVLLLTGLRRSG